MSRATSPIVYRHYRPEDATAFRELNEAWITRHFKLEEADRIALRNPEKKILAPGGYIYMAELDGVAVGCCALIPMRPGVYEVAKMTISESCRGRGAGRGILEYVIAQARELGATMLYLESNDSLKSAVHLYEVVGFRHLRPEERQVSPYQRANVFMDLVL